MRLRNQRLAGKRFDAPVDAIRWLGAVQAQDYQGAKWALAQRTAGGRANNAFVDDAFNRGDILRTHVMRPTWHFVTPEDIRWMLRLTAPRVHSVMASYNRKLELDAAVLSRSHTIITTVLAGGKHLTRKEISSALANGGVMATSTRLAHLVMHAELEGLICSGALRGKQFTYALLDERVPAAPELTRDESLARLTKRYFESHGPATPQDYGWWSGLRMADVKTGIEMVSDQLVRETIDKSDYWLSPSAVRGKIPRPVMHLLPNYDEHLVAYRDHGPSFDPASLGPRGVREEALQVHVVTRNGFVVGGWQRTIRPDKVEIRTDLFVELSVIERKGLHASAAEYGRFLGLQVVIDGAALSPS